MADRFSREWVSNLTDQVDKTVKSQSVKDMRELKSAITREVNAMKSYRRYVEKTYRKAGLEENSAELEYLKRAQKQLLQVREQINNKIKDPKAHRVSYFKILNLEKESKQKFKSYIEKEVGKVSNRKSEVRAYASQNIDKIFIDMFHRTKRSDFQMIGRAIEVAGESLSKIGYTLTDKIKQEMTDDYEDLSSDLVYKIIIDTIKDIEEYKDNTSYSDDELLQIEEAISVLRGVI